jgi:hypothetical protein
LALAVKPLQVSPEAIKSFGVRWEAERHTAFLLREKALSSLHFAGALQIRFLKRKQT